MEGRRNKKRKKDRKEEGIQGERRKEKKKSSAGFKLVRLVLLVFLPVEQEGVVGKDWFHFSPFLSHTLHRLQPAVQFLRVLLLPTRL